ncbi:hypothetical protein ACK31R_05110 [Aeromonas caviae]
MATLPKTGLYISTKKVEGMRLVVEDVFGEEGDDFFLVNLIDESSQNDYSALGDEVDNSQWEAMVEEFGLVYQSE